MSLSDPAARLAELEAANARLAEALHARERDWARLRLLQTIARGFAEADDLERALGFALRELCRAAEWDLGEAWVPRADGAALECSKAWWGADPKLQAFRDASERLVFGPAEGMPGQAWSTGKALWVRDMAEHPEFARSAMAAEAGLKAGVAIPVLASHEVVAVLGFFVFQPREEDQAFVELVAAVAAQFGALVRRKRAEDDSRHAQASLEARTRELEVAVEELRTQDQYKSDFLAAMSHELRTPLNGIIGYGELLQDHASERLNKKHQHALDAMVESGRHLLALINDLLDLSKVSAGKMELEPGLLATRGVLEQVRAILGAQVQAKGLDLQMEIAPQAEMAYGDARRVQQCILNLASNAVKFTPAGGRVLLAVVPHPEGVQFTVSDTGPGIDPGDQKLLFREFVQLRDVTRRETGGTGLGLALTKRLVELHGGHIWVDSQPGKGAAFHLVLPSPRASPRGREVLVVEDDPTLRASIAGWLRDAGLEPVEAGSGEAALAYLSEGSPSAVLLDLNLPGVTGLEVASRLRAMPGKAETPLLFVTSVHLAEVERVARTKFQGVWLPKTASLEAELRKQLDRLGLTDAAQSPAPPAEDLTGTPTAEVPR